MEKPEKPAPNECCGGGSCCPCVWDDYFAKLKRWQDRQVAVKNQCQTQENKS